MFHVKRPTAPREPTPEELLDSVNRVRADVRQWADLFDHLATIAADAGVLQASYRDLAAKLRTQSDQFSVELLDTDDVDARRDVASIYLLNMTLIAGRDRYPSVARTIESIVRDGR